MTECIIADDTAETIEFSEQQLKNMGVKLVNPDGGGLGVVADSEPQDDFGDEATDIKVKNGINFGFDAKAEYEAVTVFLRDIDALNEFGPYMRPNFFINKNHQDIMRSVLGFWKEYKEVPPTPILEDEISKRLKNDENGRPHPRKADVLKLLNQMASGIEPSRGTKEWVQGRVKRWVQVVLAKALLDKALADGIAGGTGIDAKFFQQMNELACIGGGSKNQKRGFEKPSAIMARPDFAWTVHGVMPELSFGMFWGPPGSGKSFVALDIACSLAMGLPFLGKYEVKEPKRVCYVYSEGTSGLKKRLKVWMDAHGVTQAELDERLALSTHQYKLDDPAEAQVLLAEIRQAYTESKAEVLIIDTLARNFSGDENSTKEMSNFVNALAEIGKTEKMSVLFVHHSAKDIGKGPRGSSSLTGACDWHMAFLKDDDNGKETYRFRMMKQKDGKQWPWLELLANELPATDTETSMVFSVGDVAKVQNPGDRISVQALLKLAVECKEPKSVTELLAVQSLGYKKYTLQYHLGLCVSQGFLELIPGKRNATNPNRYKMTDHAGLELAIINKSSVQSSKVGTGMVESGGR